MMWLTHASPCQHKTFTNRQLSNQANVQRGKANIQQQLTIDNKITLKVRNRDADTISVILYVFVLACAKMDIGS